MNTLRRKLRGVMGIGLTWGLVWAAIGALTGLVMRLTIPGSVDPGENELVAGAIFGAVGFLSGAGFGILLSFAESRRTILDLSLPRVAMWGVLGSAALPLLTTMQDGLALIFCPLGAACASATVAIARRAALRDAAPPTLLRSDPFSM